MAAPAAIKTWDRLGPLSVTIFQKEMRDWFRPLNLDPEEIEYREWNWLGGVYFGTVDKSSKGQLKQAIVRFVEPGFSISECHFINGIK